MNSHLIDDKSIEHILSNVEKYPNNFLENLDYKFNFNFLSIPDSPSEVCEEIVGIDGSVKLITDRIS